MKRYQKIVLAVAGGLLMVFAVYKTAGPALFVIGLRHSIDEKERFVIYQVDHDLIAQELRRFWIEQKATPSRVDEPYVIFVDDNRFPLSLRKLNPSSIQIFQNRVALEFGGAFTHFGISVFKEGVEGFGNRKLSDGVWFYAEDGKVPSR